MDEVPKQFSYMNQTGGSTGRQTGVYNYIRLYQYSDFITGADGELTLKPELPQPYQKVYPGDAMYADLNGDHIVDGNDKERSRLCYPSGIRFRHEHGIRLERIQLHHAMGRFQER